MKAIIAVLIGMLSPLWVAAQDDTVHGSQLVTGPRTKTILFLENPTEQNLFYEVALWQSSGELLFRARLTVGGGNPDEGGIGQSMFGLVPSGSTTRWEINHLADQTDLRVGSIQFAVLDPGLVASVAVQRMEESGLDVEYTVSYGALPAARKCTMPLEYSPDSLPAVDAGVAILNPRGNEEALVKLKFRLNDGTEFQAEFILQPGEQCSRFLSELFAEDPEFRARSEGATLIGSLVIESNVPVAVLGMRTDWGATRFFPSMVPVTILPL